MREWKFSSIENSIKVFTKYPYYFSASFKFKNLLQTFKIITTRIYTKEKFMTWKLKLKFEKKISFIFISVYFQLSIRNDENNFNCWNFLKFLWVFNYFIKINFKICKFSSRQIWRWQFFMLWRNFNREFNKRKFSSKFNHKSARM